MKAAILIVLGCAGIILVLRHASDAAYVAWGVVLLGFNIWISETTKKRRTADADRGSD